MKTNFKITMHVDPEINHKYDDLLKIQTELIIQAIEKEEKAANKDQLIDMGYFQMEDVVVYYASFLSIKDETFDIRYFLDGEQFEKFKDSVLSDKENELLVWPELN